MRGAATGAGSSPLGTRIKKKKKKKKKKMKKEMNGRNAESADTLGTHDHRRKKI